MTSFRVDDEPRHIRVGGFEEPSNNPLIAGAEFIRCCRRTDARRRKVEYYMWRCSAQCRHQILAEIGNRDGLNTSQR